MSNPFRYFNSSPEVIRLVVMMYVRYPLSLRNVEDLLAERGIDISHETIRFWWNRFGPMFAAEIRKRRIVQMRAYPQRRWHLDEVFLKARIATIFRVSVIASQPWASLARGSAGRTPAPGRYHPLAKSPGNDRCLREADSTVHIAYPAM